MANKLSRFIDFLRGSGVTNKLARNVKPDYNVIGDAATRAAMMPPKPTAPAEPGEAVLSWMLGGYGGPGLWPGSWTSNRIEQVQHFRHFVWEAIQMTMRLATKEPPMVVRVTPKNDQLEHKMLTKNWLGGKGSRPPDRRFLTAKEFGFGRLGMQKMQQMVRPHESFEHVEENDPLKRLLARPNDWDTGAELWQELILYLELTGVGYLWPVVHQNYPGFAEIWCIPSHWIWPIRSAKTNKLVDYYECRPIGTTAAAVPFRFGVDELIYYHYKSPLSKIDGSSPLQAGAELIDCFEKTNLARFFSLLNGANIGTVIELDGATDVNPDQIRRFTDQLKQKYSGYEKFDMPGVLPPGSVINRPSGDVELAYQASQDQLRDYIFSLWSYSKTIFGFADGINRATFEASLASAFYLTINPRLSLIDTISTEHLASQFGDDIRIFHKDCAPADRAVELREWETHAKIACYTSDEFRQWRGMEETEDGDEIINPIKNQLVKEELKESRGAVEQEELDGAGALGDKLDANAERSNEIGSGFKQISAIEDNVNANAERSNEIGSGFKQISAIEDKSLDQNSCDFCKNLHGHTVDIGDEFADGTTHCHLEYELLTKVNNAESDCRKTQVRNRTGRNQISTEDA